MLTRLLLTAAFVAALLAPISRAADSSGKTKNLIAVLQSEAPFFDKARACQQLGEFGSAEAVPVLAALLADPKLGAYARSGLEGIPDPSASAALREAVPTLKGPPLAGVVSSLGVLRDAQAVDILARLASDPAAGVTPEALLALGNIATPAAIRIVREALANGPATLRGDAAAACLLAADRARASGELTDAVALYDSIRKSQVPTAFLVGATRGAILARKNDRTPFILEQLSSENRVIRDAALLTIREVPDDSLAAALNSEIVRAAPELQGQLLLALADCHNAQSIAVVQGLSDSPSPEIRKTALSVLGRLGPSAAPPLLAALRKDRPADEKTAVLSALRALRGPAVDELLLQALTASGPPRLRVDLIQLLDSRGVALAAPALVDQAGRAEPEVKIAALSALRSLGGPHELPALLILAKLSKDEQIRDAAENALGGICSRSGEAASDDVLNELRQATNASERNTWIRVLAQVGYPKALPLLEAAARDSDPAVAENAVRELGRWPNPAPMATLFGLMDSGATAALRQRALASILDLATTATDEAQAPASHIVDWLKRASPAAQSPADKLRLLGLLGRLKTAESFRLLASYLADASVRTEAASGIVQIAPALATGEDAVAFKAALEKAAAAMPAQERERALQVAKSISVTSTPSSLFDGRSLEGWEGNTNVWRVRDGLIVGGSMSGNPRNEFLATTRHYTNFVLRLDYKLVGTEGFVNSGVQFQSVRVTNPPNEMSGYQADIGAGFSGCLYDESRRNKVLVQAGEALIKQLEKPGDWNRYEIRCEANHIQLRLNGERTVDYTETDAAIAQTGLIGLQIHGGNKAEVCFRSIVIQDLP